MFISYRVYKMINTVCNNKNIGYCKIVSIVTQNLDVDRDLQPYIGISWNSLIFYVKIINL